jgi:dTDP-4-dehydrorhamnose reductase
MTRILITGASGYLGHTLTRLLSRTNDVYAGYLLSSADGLAGTPLRFDVTSDEDAARAFETARPQCVVHAAALTKPDICEIKPDEAHALNVEATRRIARCCREFGARLVHISTDLVFDGAKGRYNEDDVPAGINEYAKSKILAEQAVRSLDPAAVILRVSVLYGPGGGAHAGFLDEVLQRWRRGEPMTFFTDQYRSPTFVPQVAEAVQAFADRPQLSGLFHLGGDRLSRYEFGVLIAELAGVPGSLVRAGSMNDYKGSAKRAPDCSLDSGKIRRILGVDPMPCAHGLRELVAAGFLQKL